MIFTPHDYQKECIDFLQETPNAALLLSMGLGKTAIVLQTIHDNMFSSFDTRRTIVIAPKNVALITWPNEVNKWKQFRDISFTVLHGPNKNSKVLQKKDLYIINYEGLPWLASCYKDRETRKRLPRFDMVVVDESTYIKNRSSQRNRFCRALFGEVKRKVLLTGTPSPNGMLDLFGQFDFVAPGLLAKTQTSYQRAYFVPPSSMSPSRKWVLRSGVKDIIAAKIAPLSKVLKEEDVLPRDKARHNTILCELPAKARKEYERLEDEFFVELEAGGQVEVFNAASLAMKLRQYIQGFLYDPESGTALQANTIKAEALKELVESLNGRPLLCAIQFQHEVDMLRKVFGYQIPALYSKTTSKEQARIIEAWNRGDEPLLLGHPASGGIGLNLQDGGSTMCWYSHTWDLQHYLQFNARIDRQGQKQIVTNHHLVMKDTIEEVIVEALARKEEDQTSFVDILRNYRG